MALMTSDSIERQVENLSSSARYMLSEHAEELDELSSIGFISITYEARLLMAYFVANRSPQEQGE